MKSPTDAPSIPIERYLADPARDELSAALLVARSIEPALDEAQVRTELATLSEGYATAFPGAATPATLVGFMRAAGFGVADNMQTLDASRIDMVLNSRRGIPITLSIPYLMVGRALGMHTQGINFPGHFLLRANDELIDPLNAELLTPADIDRRLTEANLGHVGESALAGASADDMAVRMFNNVKVIYAARGDFVAALALIDSQLRLVADVGPLHLERAELWFRLGDAGAAVSVLQDARQHVQGTRWEAEIDARLRRLAGRGPPTIH